MKRDMAAREVKRAAMRIIIMPTGMLPFRAVKAEIQPLQQSHVLITRTHNIQRRFLLQSLTWRPIQ